MLSPPVNNMLYDDKKMANETQAIVLSNSDWLKVDDALKKYALAIITIASLGVTLLLGPQALYFVIGVGAIATFAIYPDIDPEYSLWGAIFGAMYAGPLGLLAGAFMGYYLGQKYEKARRAVDKIATPINTILNIPTSIKNSVSGAITSLTSYFKSTPASNALPEQRPQVTATREPVVTPPESESSSEEEEISIKKATSNKADSESKKSTKPPQKNKRDVSTARAKPLTNKKKGNGKKKD
ncbi:MAG: hypothetical protein AB7V32_02430, partial [Candidatus Berkiella sp.]